MPTRTAAAPRRHHRWGAVAGWSLVLAGLVVAGWAAGTSATGAHASGEVAGDPVAGEQVYAANCAMCHGPDATGRADIPSLRGAVARLGADGVEATIRDGRQTNPPMPAFGDRLDDAAVDDVTAYLADLDERPGDDAPTPGETQPRQPHQWMWDRMRDGPMMGHWWGPAGWWWPAAVVAALLIIAAVVALVVWLARGASQPASPTSRTDATPRDILDARYARGEIDRDTYLQARRDLGDPPD